jgi:hypothetical protein
LVDQTAQGCEELRRPLYFVEDHQLVFMAGEVEGRVGELFPVQRRFQVEMDALPVRRDWFLRMG